MNASRPESDEPCRSGRRTVRRYSPAEVRGMLATLKSVAECYHQYPSHIPRDEARAALKKLGVRFKTDMDTK
jgi:hypothetical protein